MNPRNYQFIVEQYINNYLAKKVNETFEDKNYAPDFEIGMTDSGKIFVERHDRHLVTELDEVVRFLNSEFESSDDFSKFQ